MPTLPIILGDSKAKTAQRSELTLRVYHGNKVKHITRCDIFTYCLTYNTLTWV